MDWLGNPLPITILDLSGIPSEIMSSISGTLLKIIYDGLFWGVNTKVGGKNQPLLIVLEEAHSYLKAGEHSISSRTVQMIAKEGRIEETRSMVLSPVLNIVPRVICCREMGGIVLFSPPASTNRVKVCSIQSSLVN